MLQLVLQHTNLVNPVSRRTCFHANRGGRSCKIYGRHDVSRIKPSWNLNLTQHAALRGKDMMT